MDKTLGSLRTDHGYDIAETSDGSVYLVGNTLGNLKRNINSGGYDSFIKVIPN